MMSRTLPALSKNTETCYETMYMPVYLPLLQKYLIRFHRKENFRLKEPQLKSLPNADNNWLTQIPCEFCSRYYWYRCVSRILKNKKNGKVHSPGLKPPQSTHQLRNTVAKCTRLIRWYRLKWLFKWSYFNIL